MITALIQETQKACSECGEVINGTYYTLDSDKVRLGGEAGVRAGAGARAGPGKGAEAKTEAEA